MRLQINEKNEIISWVRVGSIDGVELVEFDETKLPDDFFEKFKSTLYLLKDGEVIENPDYVAPEPPMIGPSKQDKIIAQIMLNQAKQKEDQDKFNAQILLKLAGGMK
ncbi:hypothetical protein C7M46_00029 [Pediococcus pentosaceus]|uniref:DUF2977 domain-containing protein n=1 Tax=Pediococcus pentosaceus TaxID=1255 RepID=UPI00136468A8|nr:DUF2977 domain-containing protein [Pediococcus pentosaceus]QHM59386.1 hypothetical protein C7M46_00029 [Pediococcus pentosaceus]